MELPATVAATDWLSHVDLNSVKSLGWWDKKRGVADMFLENGGGNRIYFITYDQHGNRLSASGWHGHWSIDKCNVTSGSRDHCAKVHAQNAGDEKLCLQGFRHCGDSAEWFHNMEFYRKKRSPIWESSSRCTCGSWHPVFVLEKPIHTFSELLPEEIEISELAALNRSHAGW